MSRRNLPNNNDNDKKGKKQRKFSRNYNCCCKKCWLNYQVFHGSLQKGRPNMRGSCGTSSAFSRIPARNENFESLGWYFLAMHRE